MSAWRDNNLIEKGCLSIWLLIFNERLFGSKNTVLMFQTTQYWDWSIFENEYFNVVPNRAKVVLIFLENLNKQTNKRRKEENRQKNEDICSWLESQVNREDDDDDDAKHCENDITLSSFIYVCLIFVLKKMFNVENIQIGLLVKVLSSRLDDLGFIFHSCRIIKW